MTITGSDGTGGSGVQADIRTISALGGYAVSAITCVTMQNTLGIQNFYDIPTDVVAGQMEALMEDIEPDVMKLGMVRTVKTLDAIIGILQKYGPIELIYDPVITSSQGDQLMPDDVIEAVKTRLMPLCSLVILKQNDAEILLQCKIQDDRSQKMALCLMLDLGCQLVMLHGSNTQDVVAWRENGQLHLYNLPVLNQPNAHGLGSNLSSAIAYYLSETQDTQKAIEQGKAYIRQQLTVNSGLKGRSNELFNEFLKKVSEHGRTNNDVKFYADRLNVSTRYLAQVTKRIMQKTPKMLIDEYVVHESKAMLDKTDKTVQEIAYELGFQSQSHFTKFFKKMEGITPSNYRKND